MAKATSLARYRSKRNFAVTPEPRGTARRTVREPRFVIQEHHASTLHYDFRLEVDGVLKSWAVPKRPSSDPADKRLAVPTEDHPLDYIDFEGVIPDGQYGAGSVVVWDSGTYRDLPGDDDATIADRLAAGHLTVWLDGEKLRGGYALTRMAGPDERWLLVRMTDAAVEARRRAAGQRRGRTTPKPAPTSSRQNDRRGAAVAPPPRGSGTSRPTASVAAIATPRARRAFEVSNPDKLLFPADGITKLDLIEYYRRIAAVMLPHVRGRVVAMHRFPDGIAKEGFYQKDVPDYFPEWINTVEVTKEGGRLRQLTIENAETLAYLANQGCVAIHVWPSRADDLRHPDRLVFDLDPSTGDFDLVRRAAHATRAALDEVGLPAYLMTSGSRGLHVVSPLDRKADFDEARDFAAALARRVVATDPASFTVEHRKNKRGKRVFIDYLRNAYGQHAIAPYSARPLAGAPVATPLDWEELDRPDLGPQRYAIKNLFRRLSRKADPWRDINRHAASLRKARDRLARISRRPS